MNTPDENDNLEALTIAHGEDSPITLAYLDYLNKKNVPQEQSRLGWVENILLEHLPEHEAIRYEILTAIENVLFKASEKKKHTLFTSTLRVPNTCNLPLGEEYLEDMFQSMGLSVMSLVDGRYRKYQSMEFTMTAKLLDLK